MTYRVIGLVSGSSLEGLDIVFAELEETGRKWSYEIKAAQCRPYNREWFQKLQNATSLSAYDYLLLHSAYGRYTGEQINGFITEFELDHKVQLIASDGHTTFYAPAPGMTAQLGDGASIAAITGINVVSDLRAMDVAFSGRGAPIVSVGEKLLLNDYSFYLDLGGIANLSYKTAENIIAFEVCAATRVLNMLGADKNEAIAAKGKLYTPLLTRLNAFPYYSLPHPKSLTDNLETKEIYRVIEAFDISNADKLRTYTEHIATQIRYAIQKLAVHNDVTRTRLLVTGGGAFNSFLIQRLIVALQPLNIEVIVPDAMLIRYKEALIMALIGVLRWREEYNVLNTVTGATRNSIGGSVWIGQEA